MPLSSSDMPGFKSSSTDPSIRAEIIEQATAAPGEKRHVAPEKRCNEGASHGHPCILELGHAGSHVYEWSD